jgi:WD40 repeat protein
MNKFIALLFIIFLSLSQLAKPNDQDTLWRHIAGVDNFKTVDYFSFSPNDSLIFASRDREKNYSWDNEALLMETVTGKILNKYYPISKARFTPDGNYIIGRYKDSLVLLTADSLIKIDRYANSNIHLGELEFNDDFSKIFSNNAGGAGYRIWDFNTGNKIKDTVILKNNYSNWHLYSIDEMRIINDGFLLCELSEEIDLGPLKHSKLDTVLIDMYADTIVYSLPNVFISGMPITHDKTKFGGYDFSKKSGKMNLYDTYTGNLLDSIDVDIRKMAFTHDDKYLVNTERTDTSGAKGSIQVWDITTKELKYSYHHLNNAPYNNFALSNNDKYLAASYTDFSYLYYNRWQTNEIYIPIDNPKLIYPNPTTEFIEICLGAGSKPAITNDLRIYNIFGQIQTTPNPTPALTPNGDGLKIDVSWLPPGMYFVRNGETVRKFIKL